jgi:L-histidine Nalpha-methyltransferase / hercynylcysteine S-oxide synthase
MLIQRAGSGTLPPPGFVSPPWDLFAQQWNTIPAPSNNSVTLGPVTITLGHLDCEGEDKLDGIAEDLDGHVFGWDNESPERKVDVGAFCMDWRPVSNREFEKFWRAGGAEKLGMPTSWAEEDGEIKVCPFFPLPSSSFHTFGCFAGPNNVWPCLNGYCAALACAHIVRSPPDVCEIKRRATPC